MPTKEPTLGNAEEALGRYRAHLDEISSRRGKLAEKDRAFGVARVILFFLAIIFWVVGYGFDAMPGVGWIGWGLFALFLVVVTVNEPIRDQLEELKRDEGVIERLIARLRRDWDCLATASLTKKLAAVELPAHRRDVADDLDLLGKASLFHLVSMAATTPGVRTLAQWLAGPADSATATERAEAADALAPMRERRLRFYTLSRQVGESGGDPDRFAQWAIGPTWLDSRRWLVIWSHVSALVSVVLILATAVAAFGVVPVDVFRYSLIGLFLITVFNLLITGAMLGPAHAIFSIAMANRSAVHDYQEIFSAADWIPESCGGSLKRIRQRLVDSPGSAVIGMRDLQKVAKAGALRQSAGTFFIYLPLQVLALWDVRVLHRLEQWQRRHRDEAAGWFESLGELEALLSVAALRDEYPEWSRASWVQQGQPPQLCASGIGHPLLTDDARVLNDVSLGPPGTLLLVTGSNMSGKSTMLRSVGLNVALAGVGAPVCATAFELPSVELATSIRVSDNLSEGVSFYMAELKRLKSVVDHARDLADDRDRVCLFLLDEILQGTNSRERQIAVVKVLGHLMRFQAIGAISTHDLELADEPDLMSIATPVHFRETIRPDAEGNEQMTFDYRMHQGVSPTTNALRLLEMVGLGDASESDDRHTPAQG